MRRVKQIMGMPITIDIPGCSEGEVFENAFGRLNSIDERFSTYKPGSEVSKYAAGKIRENGLSPELKSVIEACRKAERMTDGYFSAWADGLFEPSGYVKGWAIAEAGKQIEDSGYKTYCISAGGDILARSSGKKIWNIGIQDPLRKDKILNTLSILNGAVATSGSYERGGHIINPKTRQPAEKLLSVTVTGAEITAADILATAVFAAGEARPAFIKNFSGYKILSIAKT